MSAIQKAKDLFKTITGTTKNAVLGSVPGTTQFKQNFQALGNLPVGLGVFGSSTNGAFAAPQPNETTVRIHDLAKPKEYLGGKVGQYLGNSLEFAMQALPPVTQGIGEVAQVGFSTKGALGGGLLFGGTQAGVNALKGNPLMTGVPQAGLLGGFFGGKGFGPAEAVGERLPTNNQPGFIRLPGAPEDTSVLGNIPKSTDQIIPGKGSQLKPQLDQPSLDYIKELTQKQSEAGKGVSFGIKGKAQSFLNDIKEKFVDTNAPIEDAVSAAEKRGNYKVLPKNDIRLQIDRVLRSKTLASQFAEDNGLVSAIKTAPDINALDQYMIAKQAETVGKGGIQTGRDSVRDQQLIKDLGPTYEPIAKAVNNYSRLLLDYSVKSGLISQDLANGLIKKYPDYVPLNRIFSEGELSGPVGNGKSITSLSSQSVIQKLKGSTREVASPIESLLLKTQDAFSQGERNVAARQLASYKDLPGFKGLITEVGEGKPSNHTFSFLDNGVKKTFDTTPEIAAAAKNLNQEQMGLIGKILSVPTRILQVGATGLNPGFIASNVVKDEVTSFVNSNKALQTSVANPVNFVQALFSAVKHDDLYKEVVRNAAGGTSFDIARDQPGLSVQKIRNPVGYTVRNPGELLRAVENIVGRSEELGRIKNYKGTYDALLSEGRTAEDSRLLAAKAARDNTTNFARHGSWGRVLNWAIPFFNAGVQGSRQLVGGLRDRPLQTASKLAVGVFTPIAAITAWNLSDPQRKQAYQDVNEYEKQGNMVIIPPNPVKNSKGQWQVIKIPLSQEVSNLGSIVRRTMEQANGLDPVKFGEIASALIASGTSQDLSSPNKLASSLTPQLIKPVIEGVTNTNLYTGKKIVPDYLTSQPADAQVRPNTSGTARILGGLTNTSPLKVDNAIGTIAGGLGRNLQNASDFILNKTGIIPDNQVGGESVGANIERRFSGATGGNLLDKVYTDSTNLQSVESRVKSLADQGKKTEAVKLIQANKSLFAKRTLLKSARSEVDKLSGYRNKINVSDKLTPEQKKQALDLINQQLYKISTALYAK